MVSKKPTLKSIFTVYTQFDNKFLELYFFLFALRCNSIYGSIHPGRKMTPKNGRIFFYGETYISLVIRASRCTISLCVSIRGSRGL